jgi:hypothetical protein
VRQVGDEPVDQHVAQRPATSRTENRESSVSVVTSPTHSSQISDSVRSSSAAIAADEPDAIADWIAAALPPLPANADAGASARRPTAASLMMFFMVILSGARGAQGVVVVGLFSRA